MCKLGSALNVDLTKEQSSRCLLKGPECIQDTYFPHFDAVKAEHVVPAIRHVLAELSSSLDSLEGGVASTWEGLVEPLERMTDRLSRAWGVVSHLKAWHSCPCNI